MLVIINLNNADMHKMNLSIFPPLSKDILSFKNPLRISACIILIRKDPDARKD